VGGWFAPPPPPPPRHSRHTCDILSCIQKCLCTPVRRCLHQGEAVNLGVTATVWRMQVGALANAVGIGGGELRLWAHELLT